MSNATCKILIYEYRPDKYSQVESVGVCIFIMNDWIRRGGGGKWFLEGKWYE